MSEYTTIQSLIENFDIKIIPTILHWFNDGKSEAWIAIQLGVTQGRVSQIKREICRTVITLNENAQRVYDSLSGCNITDIEAGQNYVKGLRLISHRHE